MLMQEQKKINIRILMTLALIFIVLAAGLFFLLDSRDTHLRQRHLQLITDRYQLAYNTIYNQYKQLATNIYSGSIERFEIQSFYESLLTASDAEKDVLRKELYASTNSRYQKLHQDVKLRQFHFHLQNNESFLRLHRPELFGDNLTGIRETVNYVNTTHLPIDGFEEGRVYNGYRFVFPIAAADQVHLGSMEVSFGPDALTSSMMKQYAVLSNIFIKEETIKRKVFLGEQNKAYKESHHQGYLYDKNALAAIEEAFAKKIEVLRPHKELIDRVFTNAHSGQTMSLYDSTMDIVVTTIPVLNPVTDEMVAFFTVRSQSPFFKNELQNFWYFLLSGLLLIILLLAIFYLQYKKRVLLQQQIDEHLRTRQALIESKQRYRQIFTTMADALLIFNSEGFIVNANPAACEIYGYEYSELVGMAGKDIVHPDSHNLFEKFKQQVDNNNKFHAESVDVRKDETTFDVEIHGTTIKLKGETHLLAIVRDISKRKKHEAERVNYQAQLEVQVKERTLELERALEEVKSLSGILPICSFCKKIRDDDGYWKQVEEYISEHSEAVFSHGLCQGCLEEHYGELMARAKKNNLKEGKEE